MDSHRCTLGGAIWINLANTINKRRVDKLDEPASVMFWLQENGLLRESDRLVLESEPRLLEVTEVLRSLRNLCLDVLSELEHEIAPTTVKRLHEIAENIQVRLTLSSLHGLLKLEHEGATTEDHLSYHVISSMVQTLQTVPKERIRTCEHEECILHFIDTSKSGRRRWCSMETCGNRHKAAEFYARKKQKNG